MTLEAAGKWTYCSLRESFPSVGGLEEVRTKTLLCEIKELLFWILHSLSGLRSVLSYFGPECLLLKINE